MSEGKRESTITILQTATSHYSGNIWWREWMLSRDVQYEQNASDGGQSYHSNHLLQLFCTNVCTFIHLLFVDVAIYVIPLWCKCFLLIYYIFMPFILYLCWTVMAVCAKPSFSVKEESWFFCTQSFGNVWGICFINWYFSLIGLKKCFPVTLYNKGPFVSINALGTINNIFLWINVILILYIHFYITYTFFELAFIFI